MLTQNQLTPYICFAFIKHCAKQYSIAVASNSVEVLLNGSVMNKVWGNVALCEDDQPKNKVSITHTHTCIYIYVCVCVNIHIYTHISERNISMYVI